MKLIVLNKFGIVWNSSPSGGNWSVQEFFIHQFMHQVFPTGGNIEFCKYEAKCRFLGEYI